MIYFLIFSLFFFGYFFPKSKFLTISLFFLLLVISVFVQAGYDINNYAESYYGTNLGEKSVLFSSLMILSNGAGFSFSFFRFFCFLIWSNVIFTVIKRYSKRPNYSIICCFFLPLLSFSSQLRNGVAVGFLYIAFLFLFKNSRFWNIFLFLAFILIAAAFHKLSFLYLLCLIAIFPISDRKLLIGSMTLFFLLIIVILSGQFQDLFDNFAPDNYYVTQYVVEARFNTFVISVFFFIVFFYTYLSGRSSRICNLANNLNQEQKNFSRIVLQMHRQI